MHKTLAAISFIFACLGALFIAYMLLGHAAGVYEGAKSSSETVLKVWGVVGAAAGFALSSASFFMSRSAGEPFHNLGQAARWIALGTLLLVAISARFV